MGASTSVIHPDAVRVWRGYRLPNHTNEKFMKLLGNDFIPAAVNMQIDTGLQVYVPAIFAGIQDKPDSVPDETAILFWKTQEAYYNSKHMLGMRVYGLVHQPVFDFKNSRSSFPKFFNGSLVDDEPVYLFDKPADWMNGTVKHLAAARPSQIEPDEFRSIVSNTLSKIKSQIPLDGAIACVGKEYLVYWELLPDSKNSSDVSSGIPLLNQVLPDWKQDLTSEQKSIPIGLWKNFDGMDGIHPGCCFNMKFPRRDDI